MKKTYSNNKLRQLPEATQAAIYEIGESMSLAEAVKRIALPLEMGGYELAVTPSTLSKFLGEVRTERAVETHRARLRQAAEISKGCDAELTDAQRAMIDRSTMDGIREWIHDNIINREGFDAKQAKILVGLIQKDREHAINERKLELLESKAARLDKVNEVVKGAKDRGLSKDTLREIEEAIGLL
jgi:hypothetical protein